MIRTAALIICLLAAGCVGNWHGNPYGKQVYGPHADIAVMTSDLDISLNYVQRIRAKTQPWWQADTAPITSNNPWEKFVRPQPQDNSLDPWASFEEPKLFPDGWKPAKVVKKKVIRSIIPYSKEVY